MLRLCPRGECLPIRRDGTSNGKVFAANATGKCSLRTGEEVEDGELDKQVAQYIADSGATCHLTLDADGLTNYRECPRPLGLADRRKISIADYGDLAVAFRSNDSWVHVKLHDVAHASLLSYNHVSLICRKGERGSSQAKRGRNGAIPLKSESLAANADTALRRQVKW